MKLIIENKNETNSSLTSEKAQLVTEYSKTLREVADSNNYEHDEASLNLAFDDDILHQVQTLVSQKVTPALTYIFVVGIGGSNLGTKAIYDALYAPYDIVQTKRPKMLFVDTANDVFLRLYCTEIIPNISKAEEVLVVTISKSGGTTETLANTEIILSALKHRIPDINNRTVVITDEGSAYWNAAEEKNISCLAIPKKVGGRYSVLSAVGLFPLLAFGMDITALRAGARDIRPYCLNTDIEDNIAIKSATLLADSAGQRKTINDNFVFNSELESLGKWYRQLMGEIVGKEKNTMGEVINAGLTPTVSVGSTDLHSVGQLYLGGPKDKITTFIYSTDISKSLDIPTERIFPTIVGMITGKNTNHIMKAILGGVKEAYRKQELPFMEVQLEGITPYELGAFMQFKMIEMMYLGKLLHVNPFDQPNVESYKVETKRILEAS